MGPTSGRQCWPHEPYYLGSVLLFNILWPQRNVGHSNGDTFKFVFLNSTLCIVNQCSLDIFLWFNTLRPRQIGRLFADDTFKRIFLNENVRISIKISLKFVPKGRINNIPALVLIMAWRRPGDKPLSEPMVVRSLTHICVTRPQWVNWRRFSIGSGND